MGEKGEVQGSEVQSSHPELLIRRGKLARGRQLRGCGGVNGACRDEQGCKGSLSAWESSTPPAARLSDCPARNFGGGNVAFIACWRAHPDARLISLDRHLAVHSAKLTAQTLAHQGTCRSQHIYRRRAHEVTGSTDSRPQQCRDAAGEAGEAVEGAARQRTAGEASPRIVCPGRWTRISCWMGNLQSFFQCVTNLLSSSAVVP